MERLDRLDNHIIISSPGGGSVSNDGNIRFRWTVDPYAEEYATTNDKTVVINQIIVELGNWHPHPAKFIKQEPNGQSISLSIDEIKAKIIQCIRSCNQELQQTQLATNVPLMPNSFPFTDWVHLQFTAVGQIVPLYAAYFQMYPDRIDALQRSLQVCCNEESTFYCQPRRQPALADDRPDYWTRFAESNKDVDMGIYHDLEIDQDSLLGLLDLE
jgi:hypothetical protein